MNHANLLYVLDLVLVVPALWVIFYLFAGAVSIKGAEFNIGWPWCWLGLAWVATLVLRVIGVIS